MKRVLTLAAMAAVLSGCVSQPVQQQPKPEGYSLEMDTAYGVEDLRLMQGLNLCKQIAAGWVKVGSAYTPPEPDFRHPKTAAQAAEIRRKEDVCEANFKRKSAALWASQPQALRDHYDEQARRQRATDEAIEAEALK